MNNRRAALILLIEYNSEYNSSLKEFLESENYELVRVHSTEKAFDLLKTEKPELFLIEHPLAKDDSLEALKRLRATEELACTPIIILAESVNSSNFRQFMSAGADDIISRVSFSEIKNSISIRLNRVSLFSKLMQDQLNDLRSRILKAVPHELRTPLNGIYGLAQLLKDSPEVFSYEEFKFFGLNLLESSERMRQLVERYILYTEIEAGYTYRLYSVTPIHAHHFILNAAGKVAQHKGRLTDLDLQLESVMTLLSDEVINVITFELVENAFKFSKPGQTIIVRSYSHDDIVYLEIDDLGSGLSQQELEQSGAFIQYNCKVQAQQGSGLGLIIVRRILNLAGGTIEVVKKQEKGTTIRVRLPGIVQGRHTLTSKDRFQLKI